MKHPDSSLPAMVDGEQAPRPEVTAWQEAHPPSYTLKVWITDAGRQMVGMVWSPEAPDLMSARDHDTVHEMMDAVTVGLITLNRAAAALSVIHHEDHGGKAHPKTRGN